MSGSEPPAEPEPEICKEHCVLPSAPLSWRDCCDSTSCYVDDAGHWQVVACDPPADPCRSCTDSEICVARYDGVCNGTPTCMPRTIECPQNACSPECEAAYCPSPYQCQVRNGCDPPADAFTCYGP
jgi:hypothetical protein